MNGNDGKLHQQHWMLAVMGGLAIVCAFANQAAALEPIPDKLVVLTFDDSVKSHFTNARPILKDYGFGATFFITEGFTFKTNKRDYMTWEEIAQLHRDGFEIGNHTRDHKGVTAKSLDQVHEQLEAINARCKEHGIPRTVSFAYPGNAFDPDGFALLKKAGIKFARRGGAPEYPYDHGRGFAYEPGRDHPLLIPSAGDARPDWQLPDLIRAVEQARDGKIAVLQFHGVPDNEHPWVHTPEENFRAFMKYLHLHKYKVISLGDLAKYVDAEQTPRSYDTVIKERKAAMP
ncbi:Polysaccharide deacetylase [Symmachiella macrocystis]|uniref:Polysaccharide deacetylase n=1 Tax=Symmachiella macrocystis TaxID=2527985 RepID=A0A5C6BK24_9PLAN|nr:polysaccharide deacetylase family protein [Symmachiella macrocystis]TWU12428.1 Polysaccharide deacetylase [Symmachiella macrocystis]